jgi:hypothetical protein
LKKITKNGWDRKVFAINSGGSTRGRRASVVEPGMIAQGRQTDADLLLPSMTL